MKKSLLIITVIVLALAVMLAGCNPLDNKPDDTLLKYWIKQNVKGEDVGTFCGLDEFGPNTYYLAEGYKPLSVDNNGYDVELPEEYVIYTVGPYPDLSDHGEYITGIKITDPEVSVYGITVKSSFSDFVSVFENMGCG